MSLFGHSYKQLLESYLESNLRCLCAYRNDTIVLLRCKLKNRRLCILDTNVQNKSAKICIF